MQRHPNFAVNEVIASILIVALVIALAVIIGGIVFGLIVIQPKSAYIPPEVKLVSDTNGKPQAISLYSRGGDMAVLDSKGGVNYALGIYVDTPTLSYTAIPDDGVRTFNPGQTLFLYWADPNYRITDNLTGKNSILPTGQFTLRIVDENAKLLVYNQGMTISGGATAVPTVTCTLGTGWRIWNRDTVAHTYTLKVHPSGPNIDERTIPPTTERYVWYSRTTPYQATLTTLENGGSETKGSGVLFCQFDLYDQPGPPASSKATLQLTPM